MKVLKSTGAKRKRENNLKILSKNEDSPESDDGDSAIVLNEQPSKPEAIIQHSYCCTMPCRRLLSNRAGEHSSIELTNGKSENENIRESEFRASISEDDAVSVSSYGSDFRGEPPVKKQQLEEIRKMKFPRKKGKSYNFTKGQIVVIEANTDSETRAKFLELKDAKKTCRILDAAKNEWYRFEDDYFVIRSTCSYPVVKIKFDCLSEEIRELIKEQTRIGDVNISEFQIMDDLAPEINVP